MSPASTPPTFTFGCSCGHTASSVSSVCRWNSSGKTFYTHVAKGEPGSGARTGARKQRNARLDDGIHQVRLRDVVLAVDDLLQNTRQHGVLVQVQVHAIQLAQHLQARQRSAAARCLGQPAASHQQVLADQVPQLLALLFAAVLRAQPHIQSGLLRTRHSHRQHVPCRARGPGAAFAPTACSSAQTGA
jgi:hypothetical protein